MLDLSNILLVMYKLVLPSGLDFTELIALHNLNVGSHWWEELQSNHAVKKKCPVS